MNKKHQNNLFESKRESDRERESEKVKSKCVNNARDCVNTVKLKPNNAKLQVLF